MMPARDADAPRYKAGDRVRYGPRRGVIVRVQQTHDGGYSYYVRMDDGGWRLEREANLTPADAVNDP